MLFEIRHSSKEEVKERGLDALCGGVDPFGILCFITEIQRYFSLIYIHSFCFGAKEEMSFLVTKITLVFLVSQFLVEF